MDLGRTSIKYQSQGQRPSFFDFLKAVHEENKTLHFILLGMAIISLAVYFYSPILLAHKEEKLAESLLTTTPTMEANAWLKEDTTGYKRSLAQLETKEAVSIVSQLYSLGAVKVTVVNIRKAPDGSEWAKTIVIERPNDRAKMAALYEFYRAYQEEHGNTWLNDHHALYLIMRLTAS